MGHELKVTTDFRDAEKSDCRHLSMTCPSRPALSRRGRTRQFGDMVDLHPLADAFGDALAQPAHVMAFLGAAVLLGSFFLRAFLAMVAIFGRDKRAENAYRVLRLLTRHKSDPPGSNSR